jgi:hypothetical protein
MDLKTLSKKHIEALTELIILEKLNMAKVIIFFSRELWIVQLQIDRLCLTFRFLFFVQTYFCWQFSGII